ncbi:uncharacterized protein C8R40DRAFT_1116787 [Lentinula edodes]|uniref:uncharacterized protein n=1 Tax=Lentinula edodes TaxID=5353 RepID=UPI001E8DDD7B|nr:uncharacterized protein C8R40DRAFT_1116787 [Lentinula edodes]KAH7872414.1 hypothetical protein C8R40DRAFT_1116787 [Lentinula edodes]
MHFNTVFLTLLGLIAATCAVPLTLTAANVESRSLKPTTALINFEKFSPSTKSNSVDNAARAAVNALLLKASEALGYSRIFSWFRESEIYDGSLKEIRFEITRLPQCKPKCSAEVVSDGHRGFTSGEIKDAEGSVIYPKAKV